MRNRARGKKARDKERLRQLAGRGPGRRDKQIMRTLAAAAAEATYTRPRQPRKTRCRRTPDKLRWTEQQIAERWARHFTAMTGKQNTAYQCTSCDGWHLTTLPRMTSDGEAA